MSSFLLNVIKTVVEQSAPAPAKPVTPFAPGTTVSTTRPLNVTTVDVGDLKPEPTAVTYGQQYQIQDYNSDGKIVLRTIPLSELVSTSFSQSADPRKTYLTADLQKSEAMLVGGLFATAKQAQDAILAGLKMDLNMATLSKESPPLEINLLQTPTLNAKTVYNYYTPDESNVVVQEDPNKDPFTNAGNASAVPLFVQLDWNTVDTIVECKDFSPKTAEEEALIQQFLKPARGIANGTKVDSSKIQALLRQTNVLSKDGLTLELVDTHDLPTAFNYIANGRIYKTSALATLNTVTSDTNTVDFNDILFQEIK